MGLNRIRKKKKKLLKNKFKIVVNKANANQQFCWQPNFYGRFLAANLAIEAGSGIYLRQCNFYGLQLEMS